MRFLATDLGVEDVILGYPWLSTFEPQFSWKDTAVDTNILPVVIQSPDWYMLIPKPLIQRAKISAEIENTHIGRIVTEEAKQKIINILTGESTINSILTDLAQQVEQYMAKIDVMENISNMPKSSVKKPPNDSHRKDHGTMPLNSNWRPQM